MAQERCLPAGAGCFGGWLIDRAIACQSEASCHRAYAARTSHRVTKAASGLHFIGQHVQRHLIGHFSPTISFGSAASHPRLDGPEQALHGLVAHAVETVLTSFEAAACLNEKATYPK